MLVKNARIRRSWYRATERSQDPVQALAVLSLAERWAELMEPKLADGRVIAEIAMELLRQTTPDTDALHPHTVWGDLVIDYLEECWLYGDALRRWYGASRHRRG